MPKKLELLLYICFFSFVCYLTLPPQYSDSAMQTSSSLISKDTSSDYKQPDAYDDIKKVALTFDDGPDSNTTAVLLKGLKERNIRATFFVVGKKAAENKNIIEQMHKDGHLIGNHTNTHCNLLNMSCDNALKEINLANETIYEATGNYPDFIRPPFGEWGDQLSSSLNMFKVLWDIDPRDWSVQNTKSVVNYVVTHVDDGDIILLHDIFDTSVEAALQIVDILSARGYEFVTVDEILFP